MHSHAVTRIGRARRAAAATTASTVAAPVMSYFMPTIDDGGLSDSPPESKVMPLPTSATDAAAPSGSHPTRTSRGGRTEPAPTPRMPPKPPSASAASSQTVEVAPASAAACDGAVREHGGREVVRRCVDEVLHERDRVGEHGRAVHRASSAVARPSTVTRPTGVFWAARVRWRYAV